MSTRIEELKAKQAKDLLKAEQEEALREKLPPGEWFIHVRELYGAVASVNLKQPYYGDKKLTLADILEIATALPGVPMVRVTGDYTGYLAVEQLPHYGDRRGLHKIASEEPIAPWIVKASGGAGARNGSQVDLHWLTNIDGIGLVEVKVELPFMMALRFSARRKDYMGGHRYEDEACTVDRDKLYTIYAEDDATPVAELGPHTRWGSGGSEYPRSITQAWTPLDDPCTATVADFVRALIKAQPSS